MITRSAMRPRTRNILAITIVAFGLVIGAGYCALRWIAANTFPGETTDIRAYGRILQQWSASGLVGHFPAAVPAEARNVHFVALPGSLQGGAYIQLRMQLPPQEIKKIEAKLRAATPHIYTGGGLIDHYNDDPKHNFPTAAFHTADNPTTTFEFPSHYTLYVLHAKNLGAWTSGETDGVAISPTTHEVVYWAEYW